jgi:hypothetical protein
MGLTSNARLPVLVVAGALLLGAVAPSPSLQNWEVGAAQVMLTRVMMLAERASKQNLLYQLQLAEVRKDDIAETAREIDAAMRVLHEGNALLGIPQPPTDALRIQLHRLDDQWGQVRPMALASPYDYARRSGTKQGDRAVDPLLIRHFDELTSRVIQQAQKAQQLYNEICVTNGLPDCEAMRAGPATTLLSERLLKQATFLHAKIDPDTNRTGLQATRDQLAKSVEHKDEPIVVQARSPKRGTAGVVVGGMRRDIDAYWEALREQIDAVLADEADEFDLMRALGTQRRLVSEYERYTIAIIRFGAEQRARQAAAARD